MNWSISVSVSGADPLSSLAVPVGALLAGVLVYRSLLIVPAYEKHVFVDGGTVTRVVEPGVNVTSPFRSPDRRIDMRTQNMTLRVTPQTDDSVDLRVEIIGTVRVADARTIAARTENHRTELMNRAGTAITRVCERRTWDDIRRDVDAIERDCTATLRREFDLLGVDLKDFTIEEIDRQDSAERERDSQ